MSAYLSPKYMTNIITQVARKGNSDAFVSVDIRDNGRISVNRYFEGRDGDIYATNHTVGDVDKLIDWLHTCAFNAIVEVHDHRNTQSHADPWEQAVEQESTRIPV